MGEAVQAHGEGRIMDVTVILDGLRADIEGCDLAAFADLNTRMILCVSSAGRHAQEELDAMTETAASVLAGPVAESAAALLDGKEAVQAIAMTQVDVRFYLRASPDQAEALICLCSPGSDLGKVSKLGSDALDRIMAAA